MGNQIVAVIIPCIVAIITTVWFFIGGVIDLRKMFQALKSRPEDDLDNGLVEGRVSLSDRKKFEQIESGNSKN